MAKFYNQQLWFASDLSKEDVGTKITKKYLRYVRKYNPLVSADILNISLEEDDYNIIVYINDKVEKLIPIEYIKNILLYMKAAKKYHFGPISDTHDINNGYFGYF